MAEYIVVVSMYLFCFLIGVFCAGYSLWVCVQQFDDNDSGVSRLYKVFMAFLVVGTNFCLGFFWYAMVTVPIGLVILVAIDRKGVVRKHASS